MNVKIADVEIMISQQTPIPVWDGGKAARLLLTAE